RGRAGFGSVADESPQRDRDRDGADAVRRHQLPVVHRRGARRLSLGLARTSRVVTAAALLMAVTFASLVAADVSVMRIFGVGVPLAVLVDATLVRMLLMPAFMRVLGRGELVGACTAGAAAPAVRHRRIFCLGRGFT